MKISLPTNKPKSYVVLVIAFPLATGIGVPLVLFGKWFAIGYMVQTGANILFSFAIIIFIMFGVYFNGLMTGKYKNMKSREWNQQIW
jgi:hypothetical protein